jgi:hypothetical protein
MAGPMVYMDDPKVRVFDFSLASAWVVILGLSVTQLKQILIGS